MTSQRFSNDNVASRDFLRSLKTGIAAPITAFAVLCLFSVGEMAVFVKNMKKQLDLMELLKNHEIISYFGGATNQFEYSDNFPVSLLMILCGIVVAFSLFTFAFKKNSVNVYFSMGITRTRLFFNRILAGAAELFVISVIPYLIVFAVNVATFGFHPHQFKLFAYYSLMAFISGISGLAIGSFAAAVSGSRIEAMITSGSASFIFIVFAAIISGFKSIFLHGYISDGSETENKILSLSPWTGLLGRTELSNLVTGKKVPKEFLLTWKDDFSSIVFWAVASLVIFAVALLLFKKRKNENTASFGKYAVSSALNGAMIFLLAVLLSAVAFSDLYSLGRIKSVALCIILSTLISFVAFFIGELIIRRNIKAVLRIFPVYGGLALVMFTSLLVIGTENFGTYNKLPETKNIESVLMSYDDPFDVFDYEAEQFIYNPSNLEKGLFSDNADDIKMCVEQFEKVKNDKRTDGNAIRYISFIIKLKDSKPIIRRFPVYSEETSHNYNKAVFESDYFHGIIKSALKPNVQGGEYSGDVGYSYGNSFDQMTENFGNNSFDYYGGSLLSSRATSDDEGYYEIQGTAYAMTDELRNALYEDICKMSYDEYYGKEGKPIGAFVTNSVKPAFETMPYYAADMWLNFDIEANTEESEIKMKTISAESGILIYQQMINTLEIINRDEFEIAQNTSSVKAVICPDKKLSLNKAFVNVGEEELYIDSCEPLFNSAIASNFFRYFSLFDNDAIYLFSEKTQGTYLDFIEIVYGANDVKLSRIDNKEKAAEIDSNAYSVYDTYGDNGRFVFVIYEDGSVLTKYLPEKSLSVLN